MRLINVLFLLFISSQTLFSQCYPVFTPMAVQPPKGFEPLNKFEYGDHNYYTVWEGMYGTGKEIKLWDGITWISLNSSIFKPYYNYNSIGVAKLGNRVIGYGMVNAIGNKQAPKGKFFNLFEYKNGGWDTLPGGMVDSVANGSGYFYSCVANNRIYTYRIFAGATGILYQYDTLLRQNIKILDFNSGNYSPIMDGSNTRLMLGGLKMVNGSPVNGFIYIEGDSIKFNKDSRYQENMQYGFDHANDHIFALTIGNDPTVYEFNYKTIQVRETKITVSAISDLKIFKGQIMSWYHGPGTSTDYNYYKVLCPGEDKWKIIIVDKTLEYGNPAVSKHGIFVMCNSSFKVMELTAGTLIKGTVYVDADSNCVNGLNETVVRNCVISGKSKNYSFYTTTNEQGQYELYVALDTFILKGPGTLSKCAGSRTVISDPHKEYTIDLPVRKPSHYDLKVRLLNNNRARWDSYAFYKGEIENLGLSCDSVHYKFSADPRLKLIVGDSTITKINGNIAEGIIKRINPYDKSEIMVWVLLDTNKIKPDNVACNSFSAFSNNSEMDSVNNVSKLCQKVIYSFDPNFKDCNKEEIPINESSRLEYYIGFQNEGNDDAIDVLLKDVLSSSLLPESIEVLGASHPYSISIDGQELTVRFKNIFLKPKNQDEALSHGFFKFSINNRAGLKDGDEITNFASIYFDLNQPVVTNTVVVKVSKEAVNFPEIVLNGTLPFYPNPSNTFINIPSASTHIVIIYDMKGEIIYEKKGDEKVTTIDISTWKAGLYLIRCGNLSGKLIKTE